jgi:hypothetical protein
MSRLSKLVRRFQYTQLLEGLVRYLETIDLPGDVKKQIAMAVVKALHTKTGGKWDKELESAVSGAIEWILQEIRDSARDWRERDDLPAPEPAEPVTGMKVAGEDEDIPV